MVRTTLLILLGLAISTSGNATSSKLGDSFSFLFLSPSPSPTPSSSPSQDLSESHAEERIECFFSAINLGLTTEDSVLLCTNAISQDPIRCLEGTFQPLALDQRVKLCQGAISQAPVVCMDESAEFFLTFDQRRKLCNKADFTETTSSNKNIRSSAPAHCFRLAVTLPLSQDQRVILCAQADTDAPVVCFLRMNSPLLSLDQRVRLCTELSPSSW